MKQIRTLLALLISLFVITEAAAQASSNFNFIGVGMTSLSLTWTNGSGTGRLVAVRASPNNIAYPVDFTNYTASTTFGSGSSLGNSNYVVYKGTASGLTIYGLTSGTYYTITVFEYTGTSTSPNFTTSPYGTAAHYTLVAQPTTQCSALNVTSVTTNGATLAWTAGSGSRELISVRYSTTNTNLPADGEDYTASSTYGSGDALGSSSPYSYVVYDGAGTSVTVSNMAAQSNFVANACTYDGVSGQNNYLTSGYQTVGFTTLATEPTSSVSNVEGKDQEDDAMTVSWCNATTGGGTYHLVVMNSNGATDAPVDGVIYNSSAYYGNGDQIGSSYVVYSGSGNSVRVTGLNLETGYTIRVYDYNGYTGTYNPTTNYMSSGAYAYAETNTTHPALGASSMNFTSLTPTSVTVNWTSGGGQKRIVTCKPSRRPTALGFDGTNDYVVVPYNAALQPSTALTLEAWANKPNWQTSTSGSQFIAGNGESGGYYICHAGTYMYFSVYRNGSWAQIYTSVTNLTPGWHHFAVTYDGRYTRAMIDGAVYGVNDAGANYPITYTYSNAFIIGADAGTAAVPSGSYFQGQIDEVRVWNTAQYYWNVEYYRWNGLFGYETGLVGYWRLDDGMANTTTAVNSSSSSAPLNGTLTNMTGGAATNATSTSGWAYSLCGVNQPTDFYSYYGSSSFGNGTLLPNSTYAVATTTGNNVTVTGLSPGTYYTFTVTEYDESGFYYNYDTPRMLVGETMTASSPVPTITNMSPVSGTVGALVTLTGTGFSTNTADNMVYFGATRATVSSATATQLQVIVPYGANNTPVSVQVNGLTGTYTREFNVTSSCSNPINTSSFTTSTQTTTSSTYGNIIKDWTGDGKSDILVANYSSSTINAFQGQSINGVNPPVFSQSNTTVGTNPYFIKSADMDGDGKMDMIVSTLGAGYVSVYRGVSSYFNTSTRVDLPANGLASQIEVADFDGDGKLDILCGYGSSSLVSVWRNTSSNLTLSFGPRIDYSTASSTYAIGARDMDGDGKADILYGHYSASNFSVMRSTGTPGTISFATAQNFSVTSGNVYSVAFGDFNADGKPDVACGLSTNQIRLFQNTSTSGNINFTSSTLLTTVASAPYAITANDFDGDNRHDLAVGYGSTGTISIFEATGNFTFGTRVDFTTSGTACTSINSGDFNQDGKPDISASTASNALVIMTNDMDPLASEPTSPATTLSVSGQTQTSLTLNFTAGNGANRIVVVKQGSAITNTPFDGVTYAANTVFGSGTNLGNGTYCVYNSTGNSVTVTGLTSNTQYYFAVYEYNSTGTGCTINYLLTSPTTSGTTLNTPPTLSAIANPSAICQNSGLQTVNFSGVGTGSVGETQTLTITATSSNPALIPNPTVTYTSPNATGSLSYTPVAAQYGTVVITVTVNDNASNNNTTTQTFTVTVTQQPTTAAAGPDQTICVSTATLAANAPTVGTGTWSVFATNNPAITTANLGNVNTPNTTLNGLAAGNVVTLRWTVTSGNCTPSFDDVVITRGACPLTAGFTWSPSTICATPSQINNVNFTDQSFAPSSTIIGWNWTFAGPTTPNPSSSTQQNPSNIQFTGPGTFTVTLTINDNVGGNSNVTHFITVNPYPSAAGIITGSSSVCQGATLVPFSVGAIANATTYNWTLPPGATIASGAGTNNILVDFSNVASSGAVQVQGQNACGVGASSTPFNVTVNPLPGATSSISGPLSVCQGQTGVVFSTSGIPFATSYTWTLPLGATITSSPTASTITVDFAANASGGVVDVIGNNACGSGSSSVGITVSMNPLPDAAASITGSSVVCEGATGVVYTVPSILNASTYNWTLPPGVVITSGSGTNSVTCDFTNATGSGNVAVSGVNACGTGSSSQLAVTVDMLPDSSTAITGTTAICAGSFGVQYSISAIPFATSYNWTLPPGAVIAVDNGNSITVNFGPTATSGPITVYGMNSCGNGVAGPGITVTVNPLPDTTALITGPAVVCEGDTSVTFTVGATANATDYGWTLPSGVIITSGDSTTSITVTITGNALNGQIYVNGYNGCGPGVASDTLDLTVNPLPDAASVISGPANIGICPAATGVTFTIPTVNNASYYSWTLPAGATIVGGDSTAAITVDFTSNASSGAIGVAGINGCGSGDTAYLNFAVDVVTPVDICMVTVDGVSQYNQVMWDKPSVTDIDSFRVYREITSNNFQVVGTVDYDSLSMFVDSAYVPFANPNSTFQRYKISAIDSCGNESVLSNHHRTLFMQASVGTSGEANLSWSMYEGQSVDYYRIIRDSTLMGNWEVIDSVPGTNNVYTDWSPPTTVTQCRYRVQTVWMVSCSPTRNIITSESNLEDLIVNGINDHNGAFPVDLFPNPTNSVVTIVTPANADGVTYEVMDATGRVVLTKSENSGANGRQVTQLDLSGLADGAYTIVIISGEARRFEKVILQK